MTAPGGAASTSSGTSSSGCSREQISVECPRNARDWTSRIPSWTMEKLRIYAASRESALAMLASLPKYRAVLAEGPQGYEVLIALNGNDADIVGVLDALQQYVTKRGSGPAKVELDGHRYVMHPEPDGK